MKSNLDKLRISKNIPDGVLPYANTIIDETVEAILKDLEDMKPTHGKPMGIIGEGKDAGLFVFAFMEDDIKQLLKGGVK